MSKTRSLLKPFSKDDPQPDPKELSFCCPECGNSELSQVMTLRLFSIVDSVYEDGTVEEGDLRDEEVEEVFYECAECLYPLQDASGNLVGTEHDLVKWLRENCRENISNVQS